VNHADGCASVASRNCAYCRDAGPVLKPNGWNKTTLSDEDGELALPLGAKSIGFVLFLASYFYEFVVRAIYFVCNLDQFGCGIKDINAIHPDLIAASKAQQAAITARRFATEKFDSGLSTPA